MILASCSGKKGYEKYKRNHPEQLAKDCADKFPAKTEYKPGKIDTIPGETIYVPGDTITTNDTVYITKPKYVQCPPSLVCTPDTIIKTDSAALFLYWKEKAQKDLLISENTKYKKTNIRLIASLVIMILLCAFIVFKK